MKKQVIAFLSGIVLTICVSATLPKTAHEVKVKRFNDYESDKVQRYIETMSAEGWQLTALSTYMDSINTPVSSFMVVMERNQ